MSPVPRAGKIKIVGWKRSHCLLSDVAMSVNYSCSEKTTLLAFRCGHECELFLFCFQIMEPTIAQLWHCPRKKCNASFVPCGKEDQKSCTSELFAHLTMSPRCNHLFWLVYGLYYRCLASTGKDLTQFKKWHKVARER